LSFHTNSALLQDKAVPLSSDGAAGGAPAGRVFAIAGSE